MVVFSDTRSYKVTKFGRLKEIILGRKGLVTEIPELGDIYIQTKNRKEFVEWL